MLSRRIEQNTQAPTPTPTIIATSTPTPENEMTEISVYLFSRKKFDAAGSTTFVTPVKRITNREDIGTFALEEVIKGPTKSEIGIGLEQSIGTGKFVEFKGTSTCNGKDLTLNVENEKATVQFCKQAFLSGDLSGSVLTQQFVETLKQFNTIKQVRILTQAGDCFDDMAGNANPTTCYK